MAYINNGSETFERANNSEGSVLPLLTAGSRNVYELSPAPIIHGFGLPVGRTVTINVSVLVLIIFGNKLIFLCNHF